MMKRLADEARAAAEVMAVLRENASDNDEETVDLALETETDIKQALEAAVDRLDEVEASRDVVRQRIETLRARVDALERRAGRIREAILAAMEIVGVDMVRLPTATLSRKRSIPGVTIVDPERIPAEFKAERVVIDIDKQAIRTALRQGRDVPGAVLGNARPTLAVRRS